MNSIILVVIALCVIGFAAADQEPDPRSCAQYGEYVSNF